MFQSYSLILSFRSSVSFKTKSSEHFLNSIHSTDKTGSKTQYETMKFVEIIQINIRDDDVFQPAEY